MEIFCTNYFSLFDYTPVGIFVVKKDFSIIFWNSRMEEWTGIYRDEITGTDIRDKFPHLNENKYMSRLMDIFDGGPPTIFSSQLHGHIIPAQLPGGELMIQHTTVTAVPLPDSSEYYGIFSIQDMTKPTRRIGAYRKIEMALREAQDELEVKVKKRTTELSKANKKLQIENAERKKVEKLINTSLHEKELLLSEIHHRVKNNMQVISSLLNLQAERVEDKGYAEMLKESQLRIKSMSLIHEKLYQSKDFANIDFKEYVKTLANTLIKSHGVDFNKIKLSMEIEDVSLDIENAIPNGLIINELVSNSLKYAFPEEREGEINIALRSINEEELQLVVADNGIGIPEELDIRNTDTLGLYLVTMLAERQLDGEVELSREAGTEFRIKFKRQMYKPRI